MKIHFHFLFLIFIFHTFSAQAQKVVQNGQVRLQNSGKQGISGVQLIFDDAVPTDSDNAGNFSLVFQDKKAGDFILYQRIYKEGFEIVNEKELRELKISRTDRLFADIILAKTGEIEKAKKEYYQVSDAALRASYDKELKALQTKVKEAQITQENFVKEIEALQKRNEAQRRSLDALAEKFARVNFDDVSQLYQEALTLFKAGKIEEAIKKLEGADLLERMRRIMDEERRIKELEGKNRKQDSLIQLQIKKDLEALDLQMQIYTLQNEDWKNPQNTNLRYAFEGENYQKQGKLDSAMQVYWLFYQYTDSLLQRNPSLSNQKNYAVACHRLGLLSLYLKQPTEAIPYFEKLAQSIEKIFEANSQNPDYQFLRALSQKDLAEVYESQDKAKAKKLYLSAQALFKSLINQFPDNQQYLEMVEGKLKALE